MTVHTTRVSGRAEGEVLGGLITARERRLCDCDEPCGCYAEGYAAGKNKAFFEVIASLEGPPHAQDCGCQPCQVKRACLQKVMTLMARSSPGLFELLEIWALEDSDDRTCRRS